MKQNFCCEVCGQPATQCCLCRTYRVSLCEAHQSEHVRRDTDSYHVMIPITTPSYVTVGNVEAFKRKQEALLRLRTPLEAAQTRVLLERSTVHMTVDSFYTLRSQELLDLCRTATGVFTAYYDSLYSDLQVLIQRLIQAEFEPFCDTGMLTLHVPESEFVDIQGELVRRIQLLQTDCVILQQNCLADWMQRMQLQNLQTCGCVDCREIAEALSPNIQTQNWTCDICQYEFNSGPHCFNCSLFFTLPQPVQPSAQCPRCKYHGILTPLCGQCGYGAEQPNQQTWKCFECKSTNSSSDRECKYCDYLHRSKQPPLVNAGLLTHSQCRFCGESMSPVSQPSQCHFCKAVSEPHGWTCFHCRVHNEVFRTECGKCNAAKDLGAYLAAAGLQLTDNRKKWKCWCGQEMPVHQCTCRNCGKVNDTVKDAVTFQENRLGRVTY